MVGSVIRSTRNNWLCNPTAANWKHFLLKRQIRAVHVCDAISKSYKSFLWSFHGDESRAAACTLSQRGIRSCVTRAGFKHSRLETFRLSAFVASSRLKNQILNLGRCCSSRSPAFPPPHMRTMDSPRQRRTRWLVGCAAVKKGTFFATIMTAP